jgi:hypothetical protein
MALFGIIVALGLGPAMWLGAQFGATDITPVRPPVITVDHVPAPGGVGAGAEPVDDIATDAVENEVEIEADTPRRPVESTTTARPTPTVERSATPTVAPPTSTPSPSAEPTATTSAPVSTTPTETSGQPSTPAEPVLPLPDESIGVGVTLASR